MIDYTKNFANTKTISLDQNLRSFMLKVYNYMALALVISGIVASLAGNSEAFMSMLYVQKAGYISVSPMGYLIGFAPLVVSFVFIFNIAKMNIETAKTLFWIYSIVMGLSMSSIFLVYQATSIARVFFITASIFGGMSLYGYSTKKDLTNMGSFLIMGLFGLIISSFVNIFLKSSGLQFAISIISVVIFTGLTAYNTQKLKSVYYQTNNDNESLDKSALLGAFTLYLDFINLFVQLLQFFGNRREN